MGSEFLSKIPDQDQAIVAKYIKDWDSGVTRRFQQIHEQYKPYKDLGPVEEVMSAMQINSALMADPIAFYNDLKNTIDELRAEGYLDVEIEEELGIDLGTGENPQQQQFQQPQADPRDAKIAQLEEMLNGMNGKFEEFTQSQQQQQQMQELDNMMKALHNEHGNFDDEYFLVQLQNGYSPEQAIEKWNNLVAGVSSQPRRTPPPLLGGNGNIPSGQVDPSKLSAEDRIKFMVGQLNAAQGN